jgi:hypothetical protein
MKLSMFMQGFMVGSGSQRLLLVYQSVALPSSHPGWVVPLYDLSDHDLGGEMYFDFDFDFDFDDSLLVIDSLPCHDLYSVLEEIWIFGLVGVL